VMTVAVVDVVVVVGQLFLSWILLGLKDGAVTEETRHTILPYCG
jgi:hypothetical protein